MISVYALQALLENQLGSTYTFAKLLAASTLLLITNIWQIPLCFYLAEKTGFALCTAINVLAALSLGTLLADSKFWLFSPYSWGMRTIVRILDILPNGLQADAASPLLQNTNLLPPCLLSIGLFIILSKISAKRFSQLEVK